MKPRDDNDKSIAEMLAGVLTFTLRMFKPSKGLRVLIAVRDVDNGAQYEIANVHTREEMLKLSEQIHEGVKSKVRVAGVGVVTMGISPFKKDGN